MKLHVRHKEGRLSTQVNKKFRKFERDCIKRKGDKIGTQTCYDLSTKHYRYIDIS